MTKISNKISRLQELRELILQGNELCLLPPTLSELKELNILRLDDNPLIEPIEFNRMIGLHHLMQYLSGNTYSMIYKRRSVRLKNAAVVECQENPYYGGL